MSESPPKLVVDSAAGQPDAGLPDTWSGTLRSDGPRAGAVPECRTVSCDHLRLKVKLPRDVWVRRPGGVHVAIRFVDGTPDDNLALAVYRDGVRVGASTAQVGTAQSVLLRSAADGYYDVYVVDGVAFGLPTNINPLYWGVRGFGPDAYPAPNCLEPDSTSGGLDHYKQGMSVGWTDEYNWFLPGQYVEVTGVPDGDYILDTTVDPTGRLVESDKTNNCGSVRIRLGAMGTAEPQAELLGAGPPCTG